MEWDKDNIKNIVTPLISDFEDSYVKSLEEFGITEEFKGMVELYEYLKKTKRRYRLSLDDLKPGFSRRFSQKSLVFEAVLKPNHSQNFNKNETDLYKRGI